MVRGQYTRVKKNNDILATITGIVALLEVGGAEAQANVPNKGRAKDGYVGFISIIVNTLYNHIFIS